MQLSTLLLALALLATASAARSARPKWSDVTSDYSFDDYAAAFAKTYVDRRAAAAAAATTPAAAPLSYYARHHGCASASSTPATTTTTTTDSLTSRLSL